VDIASTANYIAAPMTADTNDTNHSSAVSYAPAKSSNRSVISLLGMIRTAIAGVLMGIANLIPGVSGGTMILAMGLYQEFIDSVADVTALRITVRRVVFLGLVVVFAGGSIVVLAGVILYLLFHYPEAMFALFIGLTLGGAPLLFRELRPLRADAVVAIAIGLALMVGIALLGTGGGYPQNTAMDFVSGVVGSTTMVLPGISGSYMLLVLGQYDRIVGAVDTTEGCRPKARDVAVLAEAALWIVDPGRDRGGARRGRSCPTCSSGCCIHHRAR
jgi:putative membrane protein